MNAPLPPLPLRVPLRPPARSVLTRPGWVAYVVAAYVVLVLIPSAYLLLPASHPLHLSDYFVTLTGKIMCYAMVALAMDLIWGYAGILSLGHGLFFALGGYGMGMYLMRSIGREGVYHSDLPDFMVFLDWKAYPWYWSLTDHFWFAALLVVLVPGVLAFVFGFFAFRSQDQGRVFLDHHPGADVRVHAAFLPQRHWLRRQQRLHRLQADPGLPDRGAVHPRRAVHRDRRRAARPRCLLCRFIVVSKLGRVLTAIRDAESRAMFIGYNPLWYKLFVWTLSAVLCGIAGALYVPQVGIINPGEMSPANSIEIAIWTAVGGRGTLVGPIAGAFLVNGAKSWFTQAFPEFWLFFLGLLFVLVTLFLPSGVIGLVRRRASRGVSR